MKKQSVITWLGLGTVTFLAYQNCADQAFQSNVSFQNSVLSSPPICRKMDSSEVKPQLMYAWDHATDVEPTFNQVMASPVVGDLDGDKIPEIGFVSYANAAYTSQGVLRILNGATGRPKFAVKDPELMPFASTAPLFVDIDADGKGEILYIHYLGKKVIALNADGSLRWELALDFTDTNITAMNSCMGGFAAADLDRDGRSEIIAGSWIIGEGSDKKAFLKTRMSEVTNGCYTYAASLSSTPKSDLQIIGMTGVLDSKGGYIWKYLRTGFASSADLRPEIPGVEVIVSGNGYFTIYNGLTGEVINDKSLSEHSDLICRLDANGNGVVGGGQATVGDFDGNASTLEIAVATGKSLTIFNAHGDKIAGSVTQDCSSLSTGLTSFDFNGDGKPEIIYADEQYIRIYEMDGSNNLKVIWSEINPSGTLREYPVIADVDGDGYAELVVVANNMWVDTTNSVYQTPEQRDQARNVTGLRVFAPQTERSWMPTRAVWNQHAYLAANVNEDLTATSSTMINGFTSQIFKRNTQKGLAQETCIAN